MRFSPAYARPTLTPLGQRLLVLSERKLYDLDAQASNRDSGTTLLRGVLVRETVRTAWSAVDEGREGGLSDWSQTNAMGLDVIGEDEEEEDQQASEDRWFEDLLTELGDGEEHEAEDWTPPPTDGSATVQVLPVYTDEPLSIEPAVITPTHIEYILPSPETTTTSPPLSLPITPIDESTHPDLLSLSELEECEDLVLPPLLLRSWSSDSAESSFDSDECLTPVLGCAELEDHDEDFGWELKGGKAGQEAEHEEGFWNRERWERYGQKVHTEVGASVQQSERQEDYTGGEDDGWDRERWEKYGQRVYPKFGGGEGQVRIRGF